MRQAALVDAPVSDRVLALAPVLVLVVLAAPEVQVVPVHAAPCTQRGRTRVVPRPAPAPAQVSVPAPDSVLGPALVHVPVVRAVWLRKELPAPPSLACVRPLVRALRTRSATKRAKKAQ